MKTETHFDIIGALAIFVLTKTGSVYGKFQGRIPASEQRAHFGCVPFGKLNVTIDGMTETVGAYRKVCFGGDFESSSFGWLDFEKEIKANRAPFSLGRYSNKHTTLTK